MYNGESVYGQREQVWYAALVWKPSSSGHWIEKSVAFRRRVVQDVKMLARGSMTRFGSFPDPKHTAEFLTRQQACIVLHHLSAPWLSGHVKGCFFSKGAFSQT